VSEGGWVVDADLGEEFAVDLDVFFFYGVDELGVFEFVFSFFHGEVGEGGVELGDPFAAFVAFAQFPAYVGMLAGVED